MFISQIRKDLLTFSDILDYHSKIFSNLLICSYIGNLSFIIVRLFQTVRPLESILFNISFFYSFLCIILRFFLVTLAAASVNEENKRLENIIRQTPVHFWNKELRSIRQQLHSNPLCISVNRHFKITKSLILHIVAAVITNELALIQIDEYIQVLS
uniref:Gustatory receptor for sugar taste 64a-like n=1 Tax=Diabrotica virgifera virgifera TaxID=50390 RepID=A0A6P7HAE2_DIAVI